jgi:hypothetical protein
MPRRSSGSLAHAFRLTRALIALALTIAALAFACRATSTPEGKRTAPPNPSAYQVVVVQLER